MVPYADVFVIVDNYIWMPMSDLMSVYTGMLANDANSVFNVNMTKFFALSRPTLHLRRLRRTGAPSAPTLWAPPCGLGLKR